MPSDNQNTERVSIPKTHDGLVEAAREILSPETAKVVIGAIQVRKKWDTIKNEYSLIVSRGVSSKDAIANLAERYHYSEKTIQAILYSR